MKAPSGWQSIVTVPAGVEEEEVFTVRVKNKPMRPEVWHLLFIYIFAAPLVDIL